MADTVTKKQRSKNMASIRSTGNRSTELALVSLLRQNKITGWKRNNKTVLGRPDFVFSKIKVVIFVDGCFWHGCSKCNLKPKSNKTYWDQKIIRNKKRDNNVKRELKKSRWKVVRIWEHDLNNGSVKAVKKIINVTSA